jgi:hypothetical protein
MGRGGPGRQGWRQQVWAAAARWTGGGGLGAADRMTWAGGPEWRRRGGPGMEVLGGGGTVDPGAEVLVSGSGVDHEQRAMAARRPGWRAQTTAAWWRDGPEPPWWRGWVTGCEAREQKLKEEDYLTSRTNKWRMMDSKILSSYPSNQTKNRISPSLQPNSSYRIHSISKTKNTTTPFYLAFQPNAT